MNNVARNTDWKENNNAFTGEPALGMEIFYGR